MASNVKQIDTDMPHIGNLINDNLKKYEIKKAEVAKKINISPISINRYIGEKSIQCYTLFNISKAINVNFFDIIAQSNSLQNAKCNTNTEKEMLLQRIADLEKEIAVYKEVIKLKG